MNESKKVVITIDDLQEVVGGSALNVTPVSPAEVPAWGANMSLPGQGTTMCNQPWLRDDMEE